MATKSEILRKAKAYGVTRQKAPLRPFQNTRPLQYVVDMLENGRTGTQDVPNILNAIDAATGIVPQADRYLVAARRQVRAGDFQFASVNVRQAMQAMRRPIRS